jgi:hypothetical protein
MAADLASAHEEDPPRQRYNGTDGRVFANRAMTFLEGNLPEGYSAMVLYRRNATRADPQVIVQGPLFHAVREDAALMAAVHGALRTAGMH